MQRVPMLPIQSCTCVLIKNLAIMTSVAWRPHQQARSPKLTEVIIHIVTHASPPVTVSLNLIVQILITLFLDLILAVGSYNPSHKKAELLRTDQNTWQTIGDYPTGFGGLLN